MSALTLCLISITYQTSFSAYKKTVYWHKYQWPLKTTLKCYGSVHPRRRYCDWWTIYKLHNVQEDQYELYNNYINMDKTTWTYSNRISITKVCADTFFLLLGNMSFLDAQTKQEGRVPDPGVIDPDPDPSL